MHLAQLYRYPLKSARVEALTHSAVDGLGLAGDRRWMVVDEASGRFLSQRILPQMSQITALVDEHHALLLSAPGVGTLRVPQPDEQQALRTVTVWSDHLEVADAGDEAAAWLTGLLSKACRLVYVSEERCRQVDTQYAQVGEHVAFADGFPLLLIGQSSLDDLSARIGTPQSMLRFRPNLVVTGSAAYAEDQWKRIRIGGLEFVVAKPCSRCILTTVDPQTGLRDAEREPLTTLKTYREREGQVYFGQNLLPRGAGVLEVGMPVEVLE